MNLSIKACAPHPSCQLPKVPSIPVPKGCCQSLPVPVAGGPSHGCSSLPRFSACHLQARPSWHSHRSLLALAAPSQPAGRPEGLSLPVLPLFLGLGQTHACVHPDHGEGVWCGLSLSPAHSTEQAGAGPGEFHLCPAAQLTSHSKALDQQCLGKAVPIKY